VELVLALVERLDALDRRGLAGADQLAAERAVVAEQVVLAEVVEVAEGEGVALADRDRRRGVVHRGRVRRLLGRGRSGGGAESGPQNSDQR
jgi:hypothetical protein